VDEARHILLCGGEGVGVVTLPGLRLEVGGPAINSTPRKMIGDEIRTVLQEQSCGIPGDISVTITVPGGEELAKRTFNPKLGIIGGLSIIGTSGIVSPFSHEAFVQSIHKEMEVAKATGCTHVVLNSGAKSERCLRSLHTGLSPQAFIHYGNCIENVLQIASELQIPRITLGIMIGKAVKLAEGRLDTHSKNVTMNKEFVKSLAPKAIRQ
jgi:cobalt-precorrin-5B (C1)-methyltransferase